MSRGNKFTDYRTALNWLLDTAEVGDYPFTVYHPEDDESIFMVGDGVGLDFGYIKEHSEKDFVVEFCEWMRVDNAVIPGFNTATTLYDTLSECLDAAMQSVLDYQGQPGAIIIDQPPAPIIHIGPVDNLSGPGLLGTLGFEGAEEIYSIHNIWDKYTFDSIP